MLCLEVERIKETRREFRLESDATWWHEIRSQLCEPEVRLCAPFGLRVQAHRIGMRLLFEGDVDGVVDLICSRCLEPYRYAFDEPMRLLLEPAPAAGGTPTPGIELDPEDAELGRYAGEVLDFSPVVREVLALAWPVQPRCDENCRGLCPGCGCNRNRESCTCANDDKSRPLAQLGRLIEEAARTRHKE
jgi:uncharacterized protein